MKITNSGFIIDDREQEDIKAFDIKLINHKPYYNPTDGIIYLGDPLGLNNSCDYINVLIHECIHKYLFEIGEEIASFSYHGISPDFESWLFEEFSERIFNEKTTKFREGLTLDMLAHNI